MDAVLTFDDAFPCSVGSLLASSRKQAGMTQAQLAEATGLKQEAVSRIERGTSVPSLKTLQRLCRGLGKRLVVSFEDEPPLAPLALDGLAATVRAVAARYPVRAVYLFGSYARGEQTPGSDVDLRVVCADGMRLADAEDMRGELEHLLGRDVDLVSAPLAQLDSHLRERLAREEVLVYEG